MCHYLNVMEQVVMEVRTVQKIQVMVVQGIIHRMCGKHLPGRADKGQFEAKEVS